MAKAALYVIRDDIQAAAGPHQLCAGQIAGTEAAVHAVRSIFNDDDSDAILLVDATNAFNSLNRSVALHNIQQLCPPLARILINTYRSPASLFVSGDTILSEEGTTQGDPLAMPMYAIAMIPLIRRLNNDVTQVWYADDACACGRLVSLRQWWDRLCELGPGFGYFPNALKTWLVVKDRCHSEAEGIFAGTNVKITNEGRPYLGSAIESSLYVRRFIEEKVKGWSSDVTLLAKVAQSQPHAAYSAFTKGLASRWVYVSRTVPDIDTYLQPLEDVIRCVLIPALTGRAPPNDFEHDLFALPPRWGGLGLCNPICRASQEFSASLKITEPLCSLLLHHDLLYSEVKATQLSQKSSVRLLKQEYYSKCSADLRHHLDSSLRLALDLAVERGASTWLTALPLDEYGFALHKSAFQDALALRYGWLPLRAPTHCACGTSFSVEHALSCPKGGLPSIRHNEIRDLTATLLTEVCSQVATEPELQPASQEDFSLSTANVQDGARLDIVMNGFWGGEVRACVC